jgi:hypothetical protein
MVGAAVEGRRGVVVVVAPEAAFPAADDDGAQHDVDGEEGVCTTDAAKSLWAKSPSCSAMRGEASVCSGEEMNSPKTNHGEQVGA